MQTLTNTNAKTPYNFNIYQVEEITPAILREIISNGNDNGDRQHIFRKRLKTYRVGDGRYTKGFYNITMSFDIETTTVETIQPYATMYIWQMSIQGCVVIGRQWSQFIELLDLIKKVINPTKNQRLICFVHNLGFEFSFMRKWLNVTDAFLKDQRTILYVEHEGFIQFRDSFALTQQSLKKLAETYTNTQKCMGDLDYTIMRHFRSTLTADELGYCYNDVLILDEFARYFYDEHISKGFAPLTATAILNKEVQDGFAKMSEEFKFYIKNSHPKTLNNYMWLMGSVYRGGFVHGNELYIEDFFGLDDNIYGVDFTSSYPAVMVFEKYGYRFRKAKAETFEDIVNYINKGYAVLFEATFYKIKRQGIHSIESTSKCIDLEGVVRDNGRVAMADKMRVALTCQDALSYIDFYTWEHCEIHYCEIAQKEYLPRYLINPLLKYYTTKNKLKAEGLDGSIEYALAKSKVNSFYGLCVKMLPTQRVTYDNSGWGVTEAKEYEKCKTNGLLPYFGVYISAYARRRLLRNVATLERAGYSCLYMDTDSIKFMDYDREAKTIIEEYNAEIRSLCENAKKRLGVDDLINGLGEFDGEYGEGTKHGRVNGLKILGAKRYIITTENGHKNQTIAGLPKNILFKQYPDNDSVFEAFSDGLAVNNCKLRADYVDDPITAKLTDYEGNTETIHELSCVALLNTDFTLSINTLWLDEILQIKQNEQFYYNRNVRRYDE